MTELDRLNELCEHEFDITYFPLGIDRGPSCVKLLHICKVRKASITSVIIEYGATHIQIQKILKLANLYKE